MGIAQHDAAYARVHAHMVLVADARDPSHLHLPPTQPKSINMSVNAEGGAIDPATGTAGMSIAHPGCITR